MAKSPDAFRTISEVALQLDTPAHVLRFWESKFPQVKPVKRAGGRRYYRPDDIALLGGIKVLLHEQGLTIRGVQKLLKERGPRHVASLSALPWEGVESSEEPQEKVPAVQEAPEAVVVGPWPGAGEPELDGTAATAVAEASSGSPAPPPASVVGGVAARMSRPEARTDARPSIGRLREALSEVDRGRLRAEAARLQPLVQRLRGLREPGPARPA